MDDLISLKWLTGKYHRIQLILSVEGIKAYLSNSINQILSVSSVGWGFKPLWYLDENINGLRKSGTHKCITEFCSKCLLFWLRLKSKYKRYKGKQWFFDQNVFCFWNLFGLHWLGSTWVTKSCMLLNELFWFIN